MSRAKCHVLCTVSSSCVLPAGAACCGGLQPGVALLSPSTDGLTYRRFVDLGVSRAVEAIVLVTQLADNSRYTQMYPVQVYVADSISSPGTYCAYNVDLPGTATRHAFGCSGAVGRYAVATNPDRALALKDMQVYLYDAPGLEVSHASHAGRTCSGKTCLRNAKAGRCCPLKFGARCCPMLIMQARWPPRA